MTTVAQLIRALASFPLTRARSPEKVSLLRSVTSFLLAFIPGVSLECADIGDTVYYTTGAKRGRCYIIVTEIAKESFVGRTASLVGLGTGPGHFQRVMSSIGTTLLVLYVFDSSRPRQTEFINQVHIPE
jgi:magnesium-transporting ATPase (P-type)